MQAFFWVSLIKGQIKLPLSPPHYHLLTSEDARIQYGVDHSAYASTLAYDIGAAPGLFELWWKHGLKVLLCYWWVDSTLFSFFWGASLMVSRYQSSFGAAFTPFYRLVGPFQVNSAVGIVRTELWETITRRGILGNIIMGLIPMIFYLTLNLVAYLLSFMWYLVGGGPVWLLCLPSIWASVLSHANCHRHHDVTVTLIIAPAWSWMLLVLLTLFISHLSQATCSADGVCGMTPGNVKSKTPGDECRWTLGAKHTYERLNIQVIFILANRKHCNSFLRWTSLDLPFTAAGRRLWGLCPTDSDLPVDLPFHSSLVSPPIESKSDIGFRTQNQCFLTPVISSFKMGLSPMFKEVD